MPRRLERVGQGIGIAVAQGDVEQRAIESGAFLLDQRQPAGDGNRGADHVAAGVGQPVANQHSQQRIVIRKQQTWHGPPLGLRPDNR